MRLLLTTLFLWLLSMCIFTSVHGRPFDTLWMEDDKRGANNLGRAMCEHHAANCRGVWSSGGRSRANKRTDTTFNAQIRDQLKGLVQKAAKRRLQNTLQQLSDPASQESRDILLGN